MTELLGKLLPMFTVTERKELLLFAVIVIGVIFLMSNSKMGCAIILIAFFAWLLFGVLWPMGVIGKVLVLVVCFAGVLIGISRKG